MNVLLRINLYSRIVVVHQRAHYRIIVKTLSMFVDTLNVNILYQPLDFVIDSKALIGASTTLKAMYVQYGINDLT